jgi:hypothetical protein
MRTEREWEVAISVLILLAKLDVSFTVVFMDNAFTLTHTEFLGLTSVISDLVNKGILRI